MCVDRQKKVNTIEFLAIGPRGCGQLEHGIEIDWRL
jgi:hypothetical protein